MSYGLQVFDATGALSIDLSKSLIRLISTHTYSMVGNQVLTITVPGITPNSVWGLTVTSNVGAYPLVTINSGSITVDTAWYNPGFSLSGNIMVYRV